MPWASCGIAGHGQAEHHAHRERRNIEFEAEPRKLLSDALREDCRLTGTHVGCEHGVCGACTVLVDGRPVRACLTYAIQMEGHEITTIESVGEHGALSPLQQALHETHGLQCGFCTPGIVMTFEAFLKENPDPSEEQIRDALSGQPVPLHRLPEHRVGHPAGGAAHAGGGRSMAAR